MTRSYLKARSLARINTQQFRTEKTHFCPGIQTQPSWTKCPCSTACPCTTAKKMLFFNSHSNSILLLKLDGFFSGRNHNQVKQFSFNEPLGNIFSPCLLLDTVALPYVGKFTWVTKPFLTIAMVSLNYPVI